MEKPIPTPIKTDPLYIGLALPPTLLGAPYVFTVMAVTLSGIFFLLVKNPVALLIGVPIILIGRLIIRYDPYGIQTIKQFMVLRSRLTMSAFTWKGKGRWVITVSPWEYHTGNLRKSRRRKI